MLHLAIGLFRVWLDHLLLVSVYTTTGIQHNLAISYCVIFTLRVHAKKTTKKRKLRC